MERLGPAGRRIGRAINVYCGIIVNVDRFYIPQVWSVFNNRVCPADYPKDYIILGA
jgi:hypothetical protein